MLFEKLDMEYRVQSFQSQREVKSVGVGRYLPGDFERAKMLVVELHRGAPSLEIVLIKPD